MRTLPLKFFGMRLDEHRARVHAHGLHVRVGRRFVAIGVELRLRVHRAADRLVAGAQHLFVLGVEQVPLAVDAAVHLRRRAAPLVGGVVRTDDRGAFGGAQDRLVLEHARRDSAGPVYAPVAGGRAVARFHRARGADHVRLPVVEVQLRDLADLFLSALGAAHRRQRDVDFVVARGLDFRLGDAELVHAFAHDGDRAVERFGVDFRLGGRDTLVDERHPALQVEAQTGRLGRDHYRRDRQQRGDEQQNQGVAAAVAHLNKRLAAPGATPRR